MAEKQDKFEYNNDAKGKTKLKADDRDKIIGARLRSRRKLLGMSQRDLGDVIDITFQQIQKYENGKNKIGAARLMDFCNALKVPITFFYAGLGDIGEKTPSSMKISDNPQESLESDIMLKKETIDLVKSYYSIEDSKIRQNVMKTIQSMAQLSKSQSSE
jgi:transcriptional regulator with XRE-family HTH domain